MVWSRNSDKKELIRKNFIKEIKGSPDRRDRQIADIINLIMACLVTKKDEGKCQLSGDKVRWNATCTKWKEK